MGWKDLLQSSKEEIIISPWVGGRVLSTFDRTWKIESTLPQEHGWHSFTLHNRVAKWKNACDAPFGVLKSQVHGYLVGDRIIPDSTKVRPNIGELTKNFEKVHLIEPGLDRFARIVAGRFNEDGPLIYENLDMPLGPEDNVLQAFLDQKESINDISGVIPALDAAFRIETWRRNEAEKRRQEELERQEKEERRRKIIEQLGNSVGRREAALIDFATAARAALAVGGAVYLDHRKAYNREETIVRFRLNGRRFECTCNPNNLRIIDSGICLTAHDEDDGFEEGTRGDTFFTLESLPGVILEADRQGRLVVFRHVN